MKNELGRKLTSLTLMTIMVAGGLTFAVPGVMPAAHAANANLFVSAENSSFDNYMSGPQVIEVVVIDSDINDTDEAKGEPDVTVNGKDLRMVQAVDGNWYGYFADVKQAQIADSTATTAGVGLDFGYFCNNQSNLKDANQANEPDVHVTDTEGVAVPVQMTNSLVLGSADGATIPGTATCTGGGGGTDPKQNVVREEKTMNLEEPDSNGIGGQIGLASDYWPFIQLYELSPGGNVVVQYNRGGGAQTTTLTFDSVDQYAGLELDRRVYPQSAQVHVTVTDLWLNIDPTDEDSWTWAASEDNSAAYYQLFDENGGNAGDVAGNEDISNLLSDLMCEGNCVLLLDTDVQGRGDVVTIQDNDDTVVNNASDNPATASTTRIAAGHLPVTLTEQGPKSGVFGTYDESDTSVLKITDNAKRGISASIDYNDTPTTILVGFSFGTVDIQPPNEVWSSGESIPVVVTDGDANKNSRADEDLDLNDPSVDVIPSLSTGDPFTLGEGDDAQAGYYTMTRPVFVNGQSGTVPGSDAADDTRIVVQQFSDRALVTSVNGGASADFLVIDLDTDMADLRETINNSDDASTDFRGFNLLNYDVRALGGVDNIYLLSHGTDIISSNLRLNDATIWTSLTDDGASATALTGSDRQQGLTLLNNSTVVRLFADRISNTDKIGLAYELPSGYATTTVPSPIVTDFFSFGFTGDGESASERVSNQIIRIEAEETADNSGIFAGSLEYAMLNQLNILDEGTYGFTTIADDPSFIVMEDLTDEDAPRVNYLDLGSDGVYTQVADQEAAPSHSGVVNLDSETYKVADTVTVTLNDRDLNVDSDRIDIYTVVTAVNDPAFDAVGVADLPDATKTVGSTPGTDFSFGPLGRLLDITFDDEQWIAGRTGTNCANTGGLGDTGFSLVETETASGVFRGDFQIPTEYCQSSTNLPVSVTGTDIEVNYVDFRDASGEIIEVGDSAGVRANTGTVSLDRTVYPVPWGSSADYNNLGSAPRDQSIFPVHATGIAGSIDATETLGGGDLTIHVRISDPDFDVSASGEDTIRQDRHVGDGSTAQRDNDDYNVGPLKITVSRGADAVVLAYAGGATPNADGKIDIGGDDPEKTRQLGAITEIAPDAGIFELDFPIRYTDGPASSVCPNTNNYAPLDGSGNLISDRFNLKSSELGNHHCILQGDILTVEYTDPTDASGDPNTVTDSATFDLRNGVLQSDKSVYIIGSDMILTVIEPDWDLDNDAAETYDLDILEWDSDAATLTMGNLGGSAAAFDPEPTDLRETGDSTGIFQVVVETPAELRGDRLERGEEIMLEYTDWGPSGANFVGEEDEDINLTVFTSNFGSTIELDQKVYSWTDKVYITIVAPDHNFDSDLIDEIGESGADPIKISTRGDSIDNYKLVETDTDTGIFTGEVILTGFDHDADGDRDTGDANGYDTNPRTLGEGPTDGFLAADDDDGLTVSFEFSEDETVIGSALIRWNIGEVQWLEASYPASGTGVLRVVDPDMNLNPESVDNFDVDVWSDSDAGGIDLTVTETNEATGIFEGTVFFTVVDESSGHRLRVAEGDTITGEYSDNTLPDPYTTADEVDVSATSLIGTIVPPLERAPASNLRVVDAFGNTLAGVSVDQQVQITADLANGQDEEQGFAYIVQIQDGDGVTVALAWLSGSLSTGQSFSPSLSWTPADAGTYEATAFVWESVDNPTALSPPVSITVTVS